MSTLQSARDVTLLPKVCGKVVTMPIETDAATRPRWAYAPLITLAIISLAPILFGLIAGLSEVLHGLSTHQIEMELLLAIFSIPFLIAVANWPFIAIYFVTLRKLKRESPSINSSKFAMCCSLVAMVLPNLALVIGPIFFFLPASSNIGVTLGYWIVAEFFMVPILAVVGWLIGRGIYRAIGWTQLTERPFGVWFIFLLILVVGPFQLLSLWLMPHSDALDTTATLIFVLNTILIIAAAVALLLLRRIARDLFLVGIGLTLVAAAWQQITMRWPEEASFGVALALGLVGVTALAVPCAYAWYLAKKGVLT
jgi:hypothetical protein